MHVCIMHVNKLQKWTSKAGIHPSYIHIVLSIVNQSCISSFHYAHMNAHTHAHNTHTENAVFIERLRFRSCAWRDCRELLSTLPYSCATCCLHSRALRASPGINDHYGSIRAATRRSLCYTEKPGMKMLVGSHQGRDTDWVRERHNTQSSKLLQMSWQTNSSSGPVSQTLK